MKKLFFVLAALAMIFIVCFSGCSSSKSGSTADETSKSASVTVEDKQDSTVPITTVHMDESGNEDAEDTID